MSSLPRFAPAGAQVPAPRTRPALKDRGIAGLFLALFWFQFFFFTVPPDILTPPDQKKEDPTAMSTPSPIGRTLKLTLLFIGASVVLGRPALFKTYRKRINRPFLYFLAIVPLSYLWSISPGDTIQRFITMISIVLFAAGLCMAGWYPKRFQDVVRPMLTVLCIGSILLYLYNPVLALEQGGQGEGTLKDAWHGLAGQKNIFGPLSTMGVIFWLNKVLAKDGNPLQNFIGLGICFSCVIFSHSSTSLMATVFVCFFMFLLLWTPRSMRRYMPYIVAAFATLVLAYALAILQIVPGLDALLKPIMSFTGKDATFSNRSTIWEIIREHIQLSPLIGSGYGAYWVGALPSSPSYVFLGRMYFYPSESHNGYLESVNDLGFMGLMILITYLVTYVRQSLEIFRVNRPQGALFLALFFQQAIMNLSESQWLQVNSAPAFGIMTFATLAIARVLVDQDEARAAPPAAAAQVAPAPVKLIPPMARLRDFENR